MIVEQAYPLIEFTVQNGQAIAALTGTLIIAAVGLNFNQREAIRQRDGNKCQSLDKRIKCGGRNEVDHIIPKEFADVALGMDEEDYNNPDNLLLKCLNHHRAHPFSHHPDVHKAAWEEREEKQTGSIQLAIEIHHEEATKGHVYWNNENDRIDRRVAKARTQRFDQVMEGRKSWWPWSKKAEAIAKEKGVYTNGHENGHNGNHNGHNNGKVK